MREELLKIYETIARVTAEEERFIRIAEAEIILRRNELTAYISQDPYFRTTLMSHSVSENAPEIIKRMTKATAGFGIGPMAAVAGAIAEYAVRAMAAAGSRYAIVDNGGDIAMLIDRPVTVGIFTGAAGVRSFGLRFEPRPGLIGICTSSGRIGHSLSFGCTDAATVISGDTILADAAATALGNAIKTKEPASMKQAIDSMLVEGIEGMIAVVDDLAAFGGIVPAIVPVKLPLEKIAAA
ncbi:MAG: UPF0280 family protein [Candidatus Wallbacteria bacterium]|nr:UPF0280 family protein [Candidatus Wallbacteria bacterium]